MLSDDHVLSRATTSSSIMPSASCAAFSAASAAFCAADACSTASCAASCAVAASVRAVSAADAACCALLPAALALAEAFDAAVDAEFALCNACLLYTSCNPMINLTGFVKRLRDIMRNDAGINGDAQRIEQIAWMLFLKVYDAKEHDWEWDEDNYRSIIPEPCRWQNWAHDDKSGAALTGDKLLDFVNNKLFPTLKNLPVDASTPIKKAIVQTTFADANNYMKDGVLMRQVINVIDELDFSDYEESHAFGEIYETILKELQSAGSAGEFYTPRAVTDFMAQVIKPKIGETMADFACGTGGFLVSWLKELHKQVKTTEDEEAFSNSVYGIEKKQFPYMLCLTNLLLHGLDVPRVYHDNSLTRDVLDYTDADRFDVVLMNPPYGGSEKADVKNHFPDDLASSETADLFMSVIMYRLKQNGRAAVILPDGFLFGTDNAKVNIKKKLLREFNLHTVIRLPGSVFSPYTSITTNILFFDHTHPTEETWFYRLDMPQGYKHFSKTKPMKPEHFQPVLDWWDDRWEITEDGFDKAKKFTAQQLTEELGYNLDQCGYPHEDEEILAPLDLIHRYEEQRSSLNAEIDRVLAEITAMLGGNEMCIRDSIDNMLLKNEYESGDERYKLLLTETDRDTAFPAGLSAVSAVIPLSAGYTLPRHTNMPRGAVTPTLRTRAAVL